MKKNLPVTQVERKFSDDTPLISTTDLKGKITSVNDAFVEISGFTREELIGRAHNMVRHPDIPPAVFGDMWSKLKENKPWIGIVKNRCKDGGYYWVNAYVTPIVEGGRTIGYQSVRTLPNQSQVKRAEEVYARLNANKRRWSFHDIPIGAKVVALPILSALLTWLAFYLSSGDMLITSAAAGASALVAAVLAMFSMTPIKYLVKRGRNIIDSPVLSEMYGNAVNEAGVIYLGALVNEARIRSASVRVGHSAKELDSQGQETIGIAREAEYAINQQVSALDEVASQISQLTAAIEEVAESAQQASNGTQEANDKANLGKEAVSETISSINNLAENVAVATEQLQKLQAATDEITQATNVISDIADQTNLLALNAAIEAARAGEQGRGFAVVADEVRALAKRTQESTSEIDKAITRLAQESNHVIAVMDEGQKQAESCVERAHRAGSALDEISLSVESIADMSSIIAGSATMQSGAAETLNSEVMSVRQSAEIALTAAQRTEKSSEKLATTSREIIQSVNI